MDILPTYLTEKKLGDIFQVLLPELEFVHNKTVPDSGIRQRPDYRFEALKLIVEFDGYQHYQDVEVILRDWKKDKTYQAMGYRIFRFPYFVQMTSEILERIFGVSMAYKQVYPHGFIDDKALLPAHFCELGIQRFLSDLNEFEQYKGEIIQSLRQKVSEKQETNLVLPPSLHYLVEP